MENITLFQTKKKGGWQLLQRRKWHLLNVITVSFGVSHHKACGMQLHQFDPICSVSLLCSHSHRHSACIQTHLHKSTPQFSQSSTMALITVINTKPCHSIQCHCLPSLRHDCMNGQCKIYDKNHGVANWLDKIIKNNGGLFEEKSA